MWAQRLVAAMATMALLAGNGAAQLPPAGVRFLTGCSTSADCPAGQLCCPIGGADPGDGGPTKGCFTPIRGRCPTW